MDVTGIAWRKSSYSGSNGGACVEVGTAGLAVAVRDSKHPDGPLLPFAAGTWKAYTDQLRQAPEPGWQPGTPLAQKGYLARVSGACSPVDALP